MSKKIATIQSDGQTRIDVSTSGTALGRAQIELYVSGPSADALITLSAGRARTLAAAIIEGLAEHELDARSASARGSSADMYPRDRFGG